MKKNSLLIWIHPSLAETNEIKALSEKGHCVVEIPKSEPEPDMILGPTCWRIALNAVKYVDLAIKDARRIKKEKR